MLDPKPKILFYTGNSFGFRSLPIWHVYEAAQIYPVILLAEKLDPDTESILRNKEFFPKLEEIVFVRHPSNSSKLMIKNNKALYKTAKDIIRRYKPDIVITGGVVYPFSLYLRRVAGREGALNICPFSPRIFSSKEIRLWVKSISAHLKKPKFLPFFISFFLESLRKELGHFLYYWILPLTVGEMPFRKEPGCILFKKISGRSADYYISFSKRDYDLALKDGMPTEKLYNLTKLYPLGYGKVREFFKKRFALNKPDNLKNKKKILTIMWPHSKIGIKRGNHALISKEKVKKQRIRIINLITETLKDWKIFIKPHPETKHGECLKIKKTFESLSNNIEIVDQSEWADAYTEISDVIMGLPPTSITLYTASLICPEKPILSLDFENELLGDGYENFNGVEYINKEEKFINVLKLIQSNKYRKHYQKPDKEQLGEKNFSNFVELLEYLFNKKESNIHEI